MLSLLVLLAALASGLTACGGLVRGSGSGGSTNPGTTPGTYTITVTGSSGITSAIGTITLTVQ
jgi:ABC-type glycerol-3-phosphate transport system substrate-binding protein